MFFRHDDPTFCGSCPASPVEVPLKDSNVSDLSILLLTFKALFLPPWDKLYKNPEMCFF